MAGTAPTNYLDPLNFSTSTGAGVAGLAETPATLGPLPADTRVPPDTYHLSNLQIARCVQLLTLLTQFNKGGTRLRLMPQTTNPFAVGEAGLWFNGTVLKFTDAAGTVTTVTTS